MTLTEATEAEIDRDVPDGIVFEAYLNTLNAAMLRGDIDALQALENLATFYRVVTDVGLES